MTKMDINDLSGCHHHNLISDGPNFVGTYDSYLVNNNKVRLLPNISQSRLRMYFIT
jgi:hypothetical protein